MWVPSSYCRSKILADLQLSILGLFWSFPYLGFWADPLLSIGICFRINNSRGRYPSLQKSLRRLGISIQMSGKWELAVAETDGNRKIGHNTDMEMPKNKTRTQKTTKASRGSHQQPEAKGGRNWPKAARSSQTNSKVVNLHWAKNWPKAVGNNQKWPKSCQKHPKSAQKQSKAAKAG